MNDLLNINESLHPQQYIKYRMCQKVIDLNKFFRRSLKIERGIKKSLPLIEPLVHAS